MKPAHTLDTLIANNKAWADKRRAADPEFFTRLTRLQAPEYLWIGCADSRVPANEIVDLAPGELFVHRNVANVVVHTDLNCLSVLQYAVDVLKVKHVMVVGHYGCGGVAAALSNEKLGLINNWLRHVQDVNQKHAALLAEVPAGTARVNRLCELNVIEQVINVCQTTVMESAWEREQEVTVHGWIYGLHDGLVHDLDIDVGHHEMIDEARAKAVAAVFAQDE